MQRSVCVCVRVCACEWVLVSNVSKERCLFPEASVQPRRCGVCESVRVCACVSMGSFGAHVGPCVDISIGVGYGQDVPGELFTHAPNLLCVPSTRGGQQLSIICRVSATLGNRVDLPFFSAPLVTLAYFFMATQHGLCCTRTHCLRVLSVLHVFPVFTSPRVSGLHLTTCFRSPPHHVFPVSTSPRVSGLHLTTCFRFSPRE